MKKISALLFLVVALPLSFLYLLKPYLASLLLVEELTSDKKIEEIYENINQKLPPSNEIIINNQKIENDYSFLSFIPDIYQTTQLSSQVLGIDDHKWIEVNLTQQRLNAWEDNRLIYSYLISSGKWAPTPTGNYRIWIKLASTTMKGGSVVLGTYYYLPKVPCTMYFYKGYGIHGAYWHNNFGQPMSHGCVNMRPTEACTLFNWASVGTRVNIHY